MRTLKKEIWPYQVTVRMSGPESVNELISLDNWCSQRIGKRFSDWYSYNIGEHNRLYAFKDESTIIIFKLTWGNYGTW